MAGSMESKRYSKLINLLPLIIATFVSITLVGGESSSLAAKLPAEAIYNFPYWLLQVASQMGAKYLQLKLA